MTWSDWSHVALVDGDTVIEARALHGVTRRPLPEALAQAARWEFVDLPCQDPAAVIAAVASQIGKPYDYGFVLGVGLHRDWQADDSWACSELLASGFHQANQPLFRKESLRRVVPQHLYMLAPAA